MSQSIKGNSLIVRMLLGLCIRVIVAGFSTPAYGQSPAVELLLEQHPVVGGTTMPQSGLHYFQPNTQVAITATPRPGYRFAHWLGDVSDRTSASTLVRLDTTKIVVAVFMPAARDRLAAKKFGGLGGAGGGMGPDSLISTGPGIGSPAWSAPSGGSSERPSAPAAANPVPNPVPEPATILLVSLGMGFAGRGLAKRKRSA